MVDYMFINCQQTLLHLFAEKAVGVGLRPVELVSMMDGETNKFASLFCRAYSIVIQMTVGCFSTSVPGVFFRCKLSEQVRCCVLGLECRFEFVII